MFAKKTKFLIRFWKKINIKSEKMKNVLNMIVEYQAIIMYADGKLYLIQKKIKQTEKKANFHIKHT